MTTVPSPNRTGTLPDPAAVAWWFGSDAGDCLPTTADQLAESNLFPFEPDDLSLPFHRWGWIRLQAARSGFFVTFDLHQSQPGWLDGLCDTIECLPADQWFCLTFFWSGAWARELCRDPADAVRRIQEIKSFSNVHSAASRNFSDRPINTAPESSRLISSTWRAWRKDADSLMQNESITARAAVFSPNDRGAWGIEHVGERSSLAWVFGRDWARSVTASEPLPDEGYDDAVSAPYARVLEDRSPHLDRVVSPIQTWTAPEPFWFEYDRLLAPIPSKKGSSAGISVLCMTSLVSRSCSSMMQRMAESGAAAIHSTRSSSLGG